jgi:hypothetical protein
METKRNLLWYALTVAFGVLFSCVSYDEKDRQAEIASRAPRDKPASQASLQPVTVSQCTKIGDVSFFIERGANSCIQNLTAHENMKCEGTGETILPDQTVAKNRLFIGPLSGNNVCAETVTVSTGSPCYIVEFDSGGDHYKYCYHGSTKISCSLLGPPTSGICKTHP